MAHETFSESLYLLHPPGRAAVEAQIVAKAQGNPCFLGELTQAVAAQDADASPLVVPDTMQAALLARLDRLPPAAKRLLQTAAVIGREVPWSLLRAVANLPDDALHQRLRHLQARQSPWRVRSRAHLSSCSALLPNNAS